MHENSKKKPLMETIHALKGKVLALLARLLLNFIILKTVKLNTFSIFRWLHFEIFIYINFVVVM